MSKKKNEKQPQYYRSRINSEVLNYNVYVMSATEKLVHFLLLFAVGGAVGLIFYGGLFKENGVATFATMISNIVVFCIAGLLSVKLFMKSMNERLRLKRLNTLKNQFREFLSTLSNSLASGANVPNAMQSAHTDLQMQYSEDACIVREIHEIILGMNNGIAIEEMLSDFGVRSGINDIKNFAIVFETCYRTGGNIKDIIRRTSEIISEKITINEEIETKLTSNKLQMRVMNVIPIVMVFMMRMMSSAFAESFGTTVGVIALTIAAGIFIGSFKMGQKIMDIKG